VTGTDPAATDAGSSAAARIPALMYVVRASMPPSLTVDT